MKKFLKFYLPPILWAGVIFTLSSFPTLETSEIYWQDFVLKKSAHMIEYAVFALLIYRALKYSGTKIRRAVVLSLLIAVIYAITDEFHQSFVPGREPKIRDVFFDTIGGALGLSLFRKKV